MTISLSVGDIARHLVLIPVGGRGGGRAISEAAAATVELAASTLVATALLSRSVGAADSSWRRRRRVASLHNSSISAIQAWKASRVSTYWRHECFKSLRADGTCENWYEGCANGFCAKRVAFQCDVNILVTICSFGFALPRSGVPSVVW